MYARLKMKCAIYVFIATFAINTGSSLKDFPVEEFFKTSNLGAIPNFERNLCNGATVMSESGCCTCDYDCLKDKTCCADALWYVFNQENVARYTDMLINETGIVHKCIEAFPVARKEKAKSERYMMVVDCVINATQKEKKLCAHGGDTLASELPVFDRFGVLYKNIHCASCNEVKRIEMPKIKLDCRHEDETDCLYKLDKDEMFPCYYTANERCNNRSSEYYDLCNAFVGPVGQFTNYFCFLCNNGKDQLNETVDTHCKDDHEKYGLPLTWSALLVFSDQKTSTGDSTARCDKEVNLRQLIDGKCEKVGCPVGYKVIDSKCIHASVKDVSALLTLEEKAEIFDVCFVKKNLYMYIVNTTNSLGIAMTILQKMNIEKHVDIYRDKKTKLVKSKKHIDRQSSIDILTTFDHGAFGISKEGRIVLSPADVTVNHLHNFSQFFSHGRLCASVVDLKNVDITMDCHVIYKDLVINAENISLWFEWTGYSKERHVVSCQEFHLSPDTCPLRIISSNGVTFLNDKILRFEINGKVIVFAVKDYLPLFNGSYAVCDDLSLIGSKTTLPSWFNIFYHIEAYISIIGSSLSLLCYFLLIVTVLVFVELQNIAGLCTFALCVCLYIGDFLFLIVNFFSIYDVITGVLICEAISVAIHFSLLASQIWGVLLAFDVATYLTSMQSRDKNEVLKFYSFICISLTSIVIFASIICNQLDVLDIQYGANNICILHGFYGRIIFYFTPLLLAFVTSLLMLSILIFRLSNHVNITKEALDNNRKDIQKSKVVLKMILICGLSEGFGLAAVGSAHLTDSDFLVISSINFMYSIVKSSRGIVLFVVFTYRKLVLELYKRKYEELKAKYMRR